MGLCLDGPPPHPLGGDNNLRLGLKVIVPLLCPRSPGLGPRPLRGYLIVDSLVILRGWRISATKGKAADFIQANVVNSADEF